MLYAAVIVIGVILGCVEFFLLTRLVNALLLSNMLKMALLMMSKLLLLVGGLVIAFFLVPELLWLAGCAIVFPMLIGGVAAVIKSTRNKGAEK